MPLHMHAATRPLEPREVAQLLRALGIALNAELLGLPDAVLAWHPAPGEWCVKECLGHIIEADRRGFGGRIRLLLDTPDATFVEWDQHGVARQRNDCQRPAADLLADFAQRFSQVSTGD